MKKLLPALFTLLFAITALVTPISVLAQTPPGGTQMQQGNQKPGVVSDDSRWVIDPEVTFIGKNAARSGDFLDWTLQNYHWSCVKQQAARGAPVNGQNKAIYCDNSGNPIQEYWSLIVLYIVVPMLFVVILATSMVIIITRGKSLTIMKFIPRFVAVVLLIVFSYALLQFFYQFTDLIQGFFLRTDINKPCPPDCIQQTDLLYVGWKYDTFIGLRRLGPQYAESAFMSLLLTKLTALTYFVMVFLLLVRKIILWFFIIVSPIFPILLLYYPVRNTGKIWIGEFFRWLLYAPLFAIFLNGLVYLWKHKIPLVFDNAGIGTAMVYPTAVNILLGGPRQLVSPTNSVNLVETFALYVVSLIMLWIVILLPWILLQIFLDYAQNFAPGDSAVMKTLVNMASNNRPVAPTGPGQHPEGSAIALPFSKKFSIPKDLRPGPTGEAKEINADHATATFSQPAYIPNATVNADVLNAANIKMPSMRDIARFDTALLSRDQNKQQEVSQITNTLERIANPVVVTNTVERDQVTKIRETISSRSKQGNLVASSIMNAANNVSSQRAQLTNQQVKNTLAQMSNPASASSTNRDKMTKLNSMLVKESKNTTNPAQSNLAASILKVNEKTSDKEVQTIREQLNKTSNSSLSKSISSAISQSNVSTAQIKGVIQQVSNPASATTHDAQKVTKLKATLEKASKEGNDLATSILKVNDKTSISEIEALQQKIQQAKDKGEPIANELAELAQQTATLPMVNRVQTVSKEDYQAVRDMWKQNYQNLEVPQGMAGTRADWIKDDIANIDTIIAQLSSPDQDKVEEGMDQVSNILPFLMVGGFSQTEVVEYLKAKQEAAKDVSKTLAADEEDKVTVNTKKTETARTMSATMEEDEPSAAPASPAATPSTPGTSADDEAESPLTSLSSSEPKDPMDSVEAAASAPKDAAASADEAKALADLNALKEKEELDADKDSAKVNTVEKKEEETK